MTRPAAPPEPKRSLLSRGIVRIALVVAGVFLLMQLVPNRVENPAVAAEPRWDSPRTRELAVAACYDCHSNETNVAWYEQVAPVVWWIKGHVDEGREKLNFSECGVHEDKRDKAERTVRRGTMPPGFYTWFGLHADAKLSDAEKQALAEGLKETMKRGCQSVG